MKVTIDLPDRFEDIDETYAREALVATLYSNGKLSGHEAREILGMSRREFEDMLPRYGFSILVDNEANVQTEPPRSDHREKERIMARKKEAFDAVKMARFGTSTTSSSRTSR